MRWLWIDQITELEPRKRLVAIKNVSLAEEYLHDHFPPGDGRQALPVVPASLLIEGMAQTAGILVGSACNFSHKVILAKIVTARFDREVFPGQTVRYEARLERLDSAGASTTGTVFYRPSGSGASGGSWLELGSVALLFSHVDKTLSGLAVPEHNFVFGENLNVLLQTAGLEDLKLKT